MNSHWQKHRIGIFGQFFFQRGRHQLKPTVQQAGVEMVSFLRHFQACQGTAGFPVNFFNGLKCPSVLESLLAEPGVKGLRRKGFFKLRPQIFQIDVNTVFCGTVRQPRGNIFFPSGILSLPALLVENFYRPTRVFGREKRYLEVYRMLRCKHQGCPDGKVVNFRHGDSVLLCGCSK